MKVKSAEEIRLATQSVADEMQIEIVEIAIKEGKEPSITFFVDTEQGIDLDTCARFHEAIDPILDELDPTFSLPYTLNVSSPGLDRAFKTERDFLRAMEKKVEVKLYAPQKGKKFFEGVLKGYDGKTILLSTEKGELSFPLSSVAKINKAIDFE